MESKKSEKLAELETLLAKSKEDRTIVRGFDKIESEIIDIPDQIQLYLDRYDAYKENVNPSPSDSLQSNAKKARDIDGKIQMFMEEHWDKLDKLIKKDKQFNSFIKRLEKKRELIEKAETLEKLEKISVGAPVSVNSNLLSDADDVRRGWMEIDAKKEVDKLLDSKNEMDKLLNAFDRQLNIGKKRVKKP